MTVLDLACEAWGAEEDSGVCFYRCIHLKKTYLLAWPVDKFDKTNRWGTLFLQISDKLDNAKEEISTRWTGECRNRLLAM